MQVIQYVPTDVGYLWGSTYAKFFFWPIPRSMWPEKPEGISRIAVRYFYPEMYEKGVSMSPTIIGEAYFNFGVLGVIIIMALFGVICQSLYTFLKKNRGNIGAIAVYAFVAPYIFMTIESAPRHDSRSNLSQHSSDEKFTQPEGCGYQKHNNNPIFGDNSIVIYIFESFRGYFFECTMIYLFFGLAVFLAFYFARRKTNGNLLK